MLAIILNKYHFMRAVFLLLISLFTLTCKKNDNDNHISLLPEMLIIDSIITTTINDHGFFYFDPHENKRTNWRSPYDFYNGTFFYRFEVKDYPSENPFMVNLCIWSDVEGNWIRYKETCCKQVPITGKGIFIASSVPSSWWYLDRPVDFTRVNDFYHMGLVLWCNESLILSDEVSVSESCWDQRDNILPLTLRLSVVAVAKGHAFSGWNSYFQ